MEDFCKYFAEEKPRYTLEEIAVKREKVIENVEKNVGKRITVDNIRTVMTPEIMMKMVDKIDEEFFENKLQRAFSASNCVLSACIENKCTSVAGRCQFQNRVDPDGNKCSRIVIKMMSKVFINSFKNTDIKQRAVDNVKCSNILECFVITFCHELVHAIVFCKCNDMGYTNSGAGDWNGVTRPGNGHSKTFMSILFNVFGHTKFTHDLKSGMIVREADEREYKLDELAVGDKVIVKVRIKGEDKHAKFLSVITEIKRQRKVTNNIFVKVLDGDRKGNIYIVRANHIVKKIGASGGDDGEKSGEGAKSPATTSAKKSPPKTQKKQTPPKPRTVKKPATKIEDTLLKNLRVGDKVIMNARLPGQQKGERSTMLAEIIELNRRKKTKQIRVKVLEDGQFKNSVFSLNPEMIVTQRDNSLLPASPKSGRDMAITYVSFSGLPLTRKPTDFDKDMATIDVKKLSPSFKQKIANLPRYNWPKDKGPYDHFPEGFKIPLSVRVSGGLGGEYYFLAMLYNGDIVLGETSGFDYMRYGIKLVGSNVRKLLHTAEHHYDYKEIWPEKKTPVTTLPTKEPLSNTGCTSRNPAPPCKDGMEVRERPNGAKCCYIAKTVKSGKTPKKGDKTQKNKKGDVAAAAPKCTKQNPAPPCATGMFERERPNGAKCCYKTKK
jgi:hypothetical protein